MKSTRHIGFPLTFVWFLSCAGPAAIAVKVQKPAEIPMPGIRRIAVADFQGPERSGSQIAALLQSYLKETNHFDLVERDRIRSVLEEQHLGMAGVVTEESAVEVGRLLGVDALIFGEVTRFEVEPDERGTEKVERQEGTGQYEWVEEKNIFTGKKRRVKREIMRTVWVDQHYRIRRGTVAIHFRLVSVQTGELLAVYSDSKSYNSGKVVGGSSEGLKPQGEILSELSQQICRTFVRRIAPHFTLETRYIESGPGKIAIGKKYAENGLWDEAIAIWKEAAQESPHEPAVFYDLGVAYEIRGDYDRAETLFKKAAALKPKKQYLESIQRARRGREDARRLHEQLQDRGKAGSF